jgi:acetyltransferase-like isoleucine patch superfamily enzyme
MASKPLISVIVAVLNAEKVLRSTLDSLVGQTMGDFEIILVDGESTDETLRIVNEFQRDIAVVISEPDSGIADAWNKGVQKACANWIMFLNAGDIIHPEHLMRLKPLLSARHDDPKIFFCNVLKFNSVGEITNQIPGRQPTKRRIALGGLGFGHPGSVASIDCFKLIGTFDTNLKIAIDTDWLLRAFVAKVGFQKFDGVAYMSEGGVSDRNFNHAMREYFHSCRRYGLVTNLNAKVAKRALPVIRTLVHLYRSYFRGLTRTLKHMLLASVNAVEALLLFHSLRKVYFRMIGFELDRKSSLGKGFRFYRFGNLSIGERSVVNRSCLFDNRDFISIGKNVSIARDVSIFTAGHDIQSPFFEMVTSKVTINDGVVIFAGAKIMPGVNIGKGAVVYSGAVVTKDVPPLSIVGGVPAQILGSRKAEPIYALNYTYPLAM